MTRQHHEDRPIRQRRARRSCPHAHPEKKKNRTERGGNVDAPRTNPARRRGADRRRLRAPSWRGKKSKFRRSPMTGSSSDASNVWTQRRTCRMTRSGLQPTRRNAHSDMGPERLAEIMIVRFGRNHLLFSSFVAATE